MRQLEKITSKISLNSNNYNSRSTTKKLSNTKIKVFSLIYTVQDNSRILKFLVMG